jgi:hypothetical protein
MNCMGDGVGGINVNAKCYASAECNGCGECYIKCEGCEECTREKVTREPEVGDFVVVHQKIEKEDGWKNTWNGAMDNAVGRLAWVASGDKQTGYKLKFPTTNTEILSNFFFPPSSVRLATPDDKKIDGMIKIIKEKDDNSNV